MREQKGGSQGWQKGWMEGLIGGPTRELPLWKSLGKGMGFEVGCRHSRQRAKWSMDISTEDADVTG